VAFKPGSFSKNFAWHGTGLAKLHHAIRTGFNGELKPVLRSHFRTHCGVNDENLQLIPINFFLFNTDGSESALLSVDELVFQAVEESHSLVFDRLAIFALHLSMVGNVSSGGTPWAREFVTRRLWSEGFWRRSELEIDQLDSFLRTALDARTEVRTKCRSNYRHLFELSGFLSTGDKYIDNRDDQWLTSAVLLAWDRAILSAQLTDSATTAQLVEFIRHREIFKLLGVPEDFAKELAAHIAPSYFESRAIKRFEQALTPQPLTTRVSSRVTARKSRARHLDEIAKHIHVSVVARTKRQIEQQLRNAELAATLKELYESKCMFCESRICVSISPERFYVEAAHIRPLGRPHNGPDVPENMIVLCPNCHIQLDSGTLSIILRSPTEMLIRSRTPNHALHGKSIRTRGTHKLDAQYVQWHRQHWRSRHERAPE